jgi:chemotaxis signal transduction protein
MRPAAVTLLAQEEALAGYLEALFASVPEQADGAGQGAAAPAPVTMPVLPAPAPAPAAAAAAADAASAGRPAGSAIEPGFTGEVLLAEHRGLRLALPMQALEAILPAPIRWQRLPGQRSWMRGVVRHRGRNVPVVSLDLLAAADEPLAALAADEDTPAAPAQLVVLGGGQWALCLDRVQETRLVRPADYRLRARRERLPWLAGYLTCGLASLIDTHALATWLDLLASRPCPQADPLPSESRGSGMGPASSTPTTRQRPDHVR